MTEAGGRGSVPPVTGAPRRNGGSGGTGGTGGVSCGDLATQYTDALPAAQSCDLNASGRVSAVGQLLPLSLFRELHDLRERPFDPERHQGELGAGGLQQCCCSLSRDRVPPTDQQHVPGRRRLAAAPAPRTAAVVEAREGTAARPAVMVELGGAGGGGRCGGRSVALVPVVTLALVARAQKAVGECGAEEPRDAVPVDSSTQWVRLRRSGLLLRGLWRGRSHDCSLSPRGNL